MSVYISTLTENDYAPSLEMVQEAFKDVPESDGNEQELVRKLRLEPEYHFELEVIAKNEAGEVIGHALCSPIQIEAENERYEALALAPVSVKKAYQRKGLGKALIQALEERAQELEYTTIVVLGHPDYYAALGYEVAAEHGISTPFEVPDNFVRVKFLWDTLEDTPHGQVIYPSPFFE
ncbi:GNAT family N-acetyltransferase [Staphylococcus ratti]|uniref:N-acetyltransferase n=1 Tax=Staphylococcus ratti TaxID=2892440 RepID=A0ABY3PCD7_9STAP|nr:N-acetyltransferase [Staphylococcus ratti]UEX89987.1 N-acetyltransferase [Staphylococcus ratti]